MDRFAISIFFFIGRAWSNLDIMNFWEGSRSDWNLKKKKKRHWWFQEEIKPSQMNPVLDMLLDLASQFKHGVGKKLRTLILLCKFRCTVKNIMTILSICLSQVLLKFALFPLCFLCVLRNKSHVRFYWLKSLILICSNYLEASRQAVIIYRNESQSPTQKTNQKENKKQKRAGDQQNKCFLFYQFLEHVEATWKCIINLDHYRMQVNANCWLSCNLKRKNKTNWRGDFDSFPQMKSFMKNGGVVLNGYSK